MLYQIFFLLFCWLIVILDPAICTIGCCRYIEKRSGKFLGDTKCEKLPVKVCGAGCIVEEGEEECHDKVIRRVL